MPARNPLLKHNRYPSPLSKGMDASEVFCNPEEAQLFSDLCQQFNVKGQSPANQSLLIRAFVHLIEAARLDKEVKAAYAGQLKGQSGLRKEAREETKIVDLLLAETGLTGKSVADAQSSQNAQELLAKIFGKPKECCKEGNGSNQ